MAEVRINVLGLRDSDAGERARLASDLREEILQVQSAEVRTAERPSSSRTKGTALEWAELLVTVGGALPPVIAALQSWLSRNPSTRITVTIGDDEITLSNTSADERSRIVDAWVRRHGG